jgi:predicted P-loop ATPase
VAERAGVCAPEEPSDWTKRLIRNNTGTIKPILANAITALRHAPEWQGALAFDEFAIRTVTVKATPWNDSPHDWEDTEDILLAEWLQHKGIHVSREIAGQAIEAVSRDHGFHPVRNYLDSLVWDGDRRLDLWLETYLGVRAESDSMPYVSAVGARHMISAVARIFQPGCKADHCLILEGPQGIKKSTALRTLAGQWFTDEIGELGSKDAVMQLHGVWIIELAELDAMHRPDTSRIKAFMSRSTDHFRPPYGRRVVDLPRQCVFAGTVNDSSYLKDETGARRFWPVVCGGVIDVDALARDRDQLWAEAVVRYRDGEPWWFDTVDLNKQAEVEQAARYEGDAWDSLILEWAEGRIASGSDSVSVGEALDLCLKKETGQWTKADEMRVGRCLKSRRWERYRDRQRSMEWRYRPARPH